MLPQASSASSSLDSVKRASSKSIAPSSSALSDADETEASVGIFEPVSGIVRRKLRPSSDSWFTCHAFSKDGRFLATGEKNGTLRVWSTDSYECISKHSDAFNVSISAISFYKGKFDRLIAVDRMGNLKEFKVTNDKGSSSARQYSMALIRERESVGHCKKLRECPEDFLHQFSRDGDIILSLRQKEVLGETNTGFPNMISVRRLEDDGAREKKIDINFDESQCRLPLLSENGRSVLLWSVGRHVSRTESGCGMSSASHKFCIVPELNFNSNHQRRVDLPGERASWGEGGEYLLVWDTKNSKPRLSVYKTHSMLHVFDGVGEPVFQKRLNAGLSDWKAKIMPSSDSSSDKREVLIYEISRGRRIFSIWDMKDNVKTRELNMKLSPEMTLGKPRAGGQAASSLSRSPPKRHREDHGAAFNDEVVAITGQDVFLDFCASNDRTWIAAVAWDYQTVAMSSMTSGVTAWTEIFDPDLLKKHQVIAKEIKFDPSGKHLLLVGDGAIQAIGPSFLDADLKPARHITVIPQNLTSFDDISDRMKLLDVYRRLPSKMLAKTWEVGTISNQLRLSWFRNRHADRSLGKRILDAAFLDAALSPDGNLLALIVKDLADASYIYVRDSRPEESDHHDHFMNLRFPREIKDRRQHFKPERIFLFKNDNGSYNMALFATGERPVAVFCSFEEQEPQIALLNMKECLMINRGPDPNRVILLGGDCVSVVNLQKRIESIRPYQANIGRLTQQIYRSMQWSRGEQCTERRISDNGDAVLLGWDTKNQRSIVITPGMRHSECQTLINEADNTVSECCALSASGAYTAFFDVNDLGDERITIGIFSEKDKKIIFRIEVSQDKRLHFLQSDTVVKLISNVFYGFSEDETELIVSTFKTVDALDAEEPLLLDELQRFKIRSATRCVTNRDLLRLVDGSSDPELVQQLCNLHGCSLFNTPLPTNQTLFQEVFGRRDMLSIERIKELVREQQYELSLEWEVPVEQTPSTEKVSNRRLSVRRTRPGAASPVARHLPSAVKPRESTDLLKEALATNETNDIKEAVRLVCSDIAPFVSSARIMKKSFQALLTKEYRIFEEILSRDSLLCEVCRLDVHVDFMNPRLRREDAVHINTTDSYLAWSEVSEQEVLHELWKSKNKQETEKLEKDDNTLTTKAKLMFVRIEDAAKAGMRGIIRPLLLARAPVHVFNTNAVKTVIQYKWHRIWQKRSIRSLLMYLVFVSVFTCYALLVVAPSANSTGFSFREIFNCCLAVVVYCFGWRMMVVEFRQILTFSREGRDYFEGRFSGLAHYFFSKWNWIDILSSTLLSMVIPLLHFASLFSGEFERHVAMFVAVESILVYAKIWYYVQPFRRMGSLVVMMNNIVRDCTSCLILAFVYTVGFGLSLFILFKHAEKKDPKDANKLDDTSGSEEFQNFPKSLLTLFHAFLGSFEPDIYHMDESLWSWMISIVFVAYLLVQTLLLLNLVLAIMGDTYDKVKLTEDAVFLYKQAQHIDALEAELTWEQMKEVDFRVGKYVCKLVSIDGKDDDGEMSGRMNMIQTAVQNVLQEWGKELAKEIQRNAGRMEVIRMENAKRMDEMRRENAEQMEAMRIETAERIEKMRREISTQSAANAEEIRREISTQSAANAEEMRREISTQSAANAERMEQKIMKNATQMEQIMSLLNKD